MNVTRNPLRTARRAALHLAVTLFALLPLSATAQTIELWVHEFPPLQEALTTRWIPQFEAANPGVTVKMTAIPFTGVVSYQAKLLTALSTGGGPDLFDLGSWEYERFLDNGYLAPLDPTLLGYADTSALLADYVPNTLTFATRDGSVYALFSEYNTLALFFNQDMFDAAGIPYLSETEPTSWDDIGNIAGRLTKRDARTGAYDAVGYQFGFFSNFRSPQWYAQNFYAIMRQHGQDDIYVDGVPAADSEAAVAAFQTIYDFTFVYDAYNPDAIANWFGDFPQERVGMVLAGTWFVPAIRGFDPDQRFGVAPHPVTDPSDRDTWKNIQWSWGWSLNPNSDAARREAAHAFLRFMLGGDGDADQAAWWFQNLGYLQPKQGLFEHPDYLAYLEANPWLNAFTQAFEDYELGYVQHSYDEAGAALVRAIDRIIYDRMTPADTARLLQNELVRGF